MACLIPMNESISVTISDRQLYGIFPGTYDFSLYIWTDPWGHQSYLWQSDMCHDTYKYGYSLKRHIWLRNLKGGYRVLDSKTHPTNHELAIAVYRLMNFNADCGTIRI